MSKLGASHTDRYESTVTHSPDMGNCVSMQVQDAQDALAEWSAEDATQTDILAQLPMACLVSVNVADHVAGRVYQCAQDSELGQLTARGWAALLAVEVAS